MPVWGPVRGVVAQNTSIVRREEGEIDKSQVVANDRSMRVLPYFFSKQSFTSLTTDDCSFIHGLERFVRRVSRFNHNRLYAGRTCIVHAASKACTRLMKAGYTPSLRNMAVVLGKAADLCRAAMFSQPRVIERIAGRRNLICSEHRHSVWLALILEIFRTSDWGVLMKTKYLFLKMVVDRDHEPDDKDWCPPLDRRAALKIFGVGAIGSVVAGCGSSSSSASSSSTATTISLGASSTSPKVGASVTLTAMVAPSVATGTVTFYSGTTSLGNGTLSGGTATLSTSFSSAQTATITAMYAGDGTYGASTSSALTITLTAVVGTTSSSTSLSVSTTATTVGASITLTAQVTPSAATGTVTFYNGTTSLGSGSVSNGIATLTTSFSSAQTASLTASYAGDSSYAASTSGVVSVAVTATTSSTCGTSVPAVTEGPYWVTDSAFGYNRSTITSDLAGTNTQSGVPFTLVLYVYDRNNSCVAMQNVQVDIWHCNAAGVYSGIKSSTNGNGVDYTSQSWLRGYQLTDSTGMVKFVTIVPGWYTGRTTHIHMRFRSTYNSSSDGSTNTAQLFFDQTFIDSLDTTVTPYKSEGKNSVTNAGDSIYNSEGGTTLLSLSGSASAGYTATFSIYLPLS